MERNKLIALIVSIILGFFAVVAVQMYINREREKTIKDEGSAQILVAAGTLKRGSKITPNDLRTKLWPAENVLQKEMFLRSQLDELINQQLNRQIGKDQPIMKHHLEMWQKFEPVPCISI